MSRARLLAALLALCTLGAKCPQGVKPDTQMHAFAAGPDVTVGVLGCGHQPIVGYTHCRVMEGEVANRSITLLAPPAVCAREDACVFFEIYNRDGALVHSGSIPKGQTRTTFSWVQLIKKNFFSAGDRGFWGIAMTIYSLDPEGNEQITHEEGEIRLRVLKKEYHDLHEAPRDPNYVWEWTEDGYTVRKTQGGRTWIGKEIP